VEQAASNAAVARENAINGRLEREVERIKRHPLQLVQLVAIMLWNNPIIARAVSDEGFARALLQLQAGRGWDAPCQGFALTGPILNCPDRAAILGYKARSAVIIAAGSRQRNENLLRDVGLGNRGRWALPTGFGLGEKAARAISLQNKKGLTVIDG
jgi:hypothetical protein